MKSVLTVVLLSWNQSLSIAFMQDVSRVVVNDYICQHGNSPLFAEGFGSAATKDRRKRELSATLDLSSIECLSVADAKKQLIDLIPRMTGKDEEYRAVEAYVNLLEDKYSPVQTIDFLNLAIAGDWQLVSQYFRMIVTLVTRNISVTHIAFCSLKHRKLFSTNLIGSSSRKLRLRELVQRIESTGFSGSLTNVAQWDLAEDGETFDAKGSFSVKCSYKINQGARMIVDLTDHELRPARGSKIPDDVPGLVGE